MRENVKSQPETGCNYNELLGIFLSENGDRGKVVFTTQFVLGMPTPPSLHNLKPSSRWARSGSTPATGYPSSPWGISAPVPRASRSLTRPPPSPTPSGSPRASRSPARSSPAPSGSACRHPERGASSGRAPPDASSCVPASPG